MCAFTSLHITCIFPQVRLSPAEGSDVLKRWAEHLCSPQVNQKSKAILVLLSLGCFYKVGEMLHRYSENTSQAGLFIQVLGLKRASASQLMAGPHTETNDRLRIQTALFFL